MSINYQKVFQQVRELVEKEKGKQEALEERKVLASTIFNNFLNQADALATKVERARIADPSLRCAMITAEPLSAHYEVPKLSPKTILIASDGSQILPDRHHSAYYGLINTGAIVLRMDSGEAPEIITDSILLSKERLTTSAGLPISDAMLGLMRDTEERITLLNLVVNASKAGDQVITLTDGPIELWGKRDGEEAQLFEENLRKYLSTLSQIHDYNAITAGYIDRPGSNPVARMLEVYLAGDENINSFKQYHPLEGISDRWLFGGTKTPLLGPGERSAVFALKSRSESDYAGIFAIHFFYLNVSNDSAHPQIARIEVPSWVAQDEAKLGQLHACVVQQCNLLAPKPFPYLLHRAHEIAVVSYEEKKHIDQMFQIESLNHDGEIGDISNKQTPKDAVGRTKFKK